MDLLYPRLCLLCHAPLMNINGNYHICYQCQSKIHMNRPPFCRKCSRPTENLRGLYCPSCIKTHYYFDRAWAATLYNDTMRQMIHLFKYGNKTSLRYIFYEFITEFIDTYLIPISQFDLIIPIPLHPVRLRERGYNQSLLIAQMLSYDHTIPCETNSLQRRRNTRYQARLSQKERWTNIKAAFKINHHNNIIDKNILIVDDLLTTGATLSEAARILKAHGAAHVAALTLSITASPDEMERV